MSNAKMTGNKIATARKKINISQIQLAQRLFISSQAGQMTYVFLKNRKADPGGITLLIPRSNNIMPQNEIAIPGLPERRKSK